MQSSQTLLEEMEARRAELYDLIKTFSTPGWDQFIGDLQEWRDSLAESAVLDCDTSEKWLTRRAVIQNLDHILQYQFNSETELEAMEQGTVLKDIDDGRNELED